MKLAGPITKHLTWEEATVTEHRDFLDQQNPPPGHIQDNIRSFAEGYFEPARRVLGPIRVNSLYRCPSLNKTIGGSRHSRHMLGLAADIFPLHRGLRESMKSLISMGIYDQVIWEFGRWIHIGAPLQGKLPRTEYLAVWEPGRYEKWNGDDPRVLGAGNGHRNIA